MKLILTFLFVIFTLAGYSQGITVTVGDKISVDTITGDIAASQIANFQDSVTANTNVTSNTTHRSSDGSDHTFINQDVTSTGSPTFDNLVADSINVDSINIQSQLSFDNGATITNTEPDTIFLAEVIVKIDGDLYITGDVIIKETIGIIHDSLVIKRECSNVADDGTITLPDATTQSLLIWVDGDDEWAQCAIQADGTVTILISVGSVVNTDTDTNLCIFDSGTGATIRNRLGSSKTVCYKTEYKQ